MVNTYSSTYGSTYGSKNNQNATFNSVRQQLDTLENESNKFKQEAEREKKRGDRLQEEVDTKNNTIKRLNEDFSSLEKDLANSQSNVDNLLREKQQLEEQIQQQKKEIEDLNGKLKTATLVNKGAIRSSETSVLIKKIEEIRKKILNDLLDVIDPFYYDITDHDAFEVLMIQSVFENVGLDSAVPPDELIQKTCTIFHEKAKPFLKKPQDLRSNTDFKKIVSRALEMNTVASSSSEVSLTFKRPVEKGEKVEFKQKIIAPSFALRGKVLYSCIAPGLVVGQDNSFAILPLFCETTYL